MTDVEVLSIINKAIKEAEGNEVYLEDRLDSANLDSLGTLMVTSALDAEFPNALDTTTLTVGTRVITLVEKCLAVKNG